MKTALSLLLALGLGWSLGQETTPPPPKQQAFAAGELVARLKAGEHRWLPFLEREALSSGIYRLPKGGVDGQSPHADDEVYHVLAGRARLTAGEETFAVEPGSIVYVAAGVEHRFHDIEEDLEVLVFFSKYRPAETR